MSSTYSINPGTSTEAFKLSDINSVLNELPDNITKLINPHDLRDAVYTAWENIAFKPTTNSSNVEYVGFDQATFREKIFLGKKQLGNTDILNTNLLNTDVDLFLYNTKSDTNLSQQNLKIGLLAGSDTSLFFVNGTLSIPTIEAKSVVSTYGNVIDLDIKNNSYAQLGLSYSGGNINIFSDKGTVLINGLSFPTLAQNTGVSNGYVLSYQSGGFLQWAPNVVSITTISQSGTFSINANPLIINGYNAMFSSSIPTPTAVGAIPAGTTFSNVAVTEMIRLMLYPYIAPTSSITPLSITNEYSTAPITFTFSYTITKYISNTTVTVTTKPTFITDVYAQTYLNAAPTINRSYTGTGSYGPASFTTPQTFTLSVSDSVGTYSSSITLNPILPIFYGTSITATNSASGVGSLLNSFNKIISTDPNQTVSLNGNGVCIYYLVPQIYNISGSMSGLYAGSSASFNQKDVFRGTGTPFTLTLNYGSYWSGITYNCYIYSPFNNPTITTIGSYPLYNSTYQFNF